MHPRQTERTAVRARLVFPIWSPPVENAVITCHDGIITAIGPYDGDQSVVDAGDVAVLPALVNAHTHLEFSLLAKPLGQHTSTFTGWIEQVLAYRSGRDGSDPSAVARALTAGLTEAGQTGTALVGNIATHETPPDQGSLYEPTAGGLLPDDRANDRPPTALAGVEFLELLGLKRQRVEQQTRRAVAFLAGRSALSPRWLPGLSPHAPYTAARELVAVSAALSRAHRVPVAMHLAETREELQLLDQQQGPLRDLLEQRGVWYPPAFFPGTRPLDYLQLLKQADRTLVVHGNYLRPDEWDFLAEHHDRMSLVYCPRTHAYFGHDEYPLAQLLERGVHLALGTDSRASNPDLSQWHEMRYVAAHHPAVSPRQIVELGTLSAALALGVAHCGGQIRPGMPASLITVEIGSDRVRDPHELLFRSSALPQRLRIQTDG